MSKVAHYLQEHLVGETMFGTDARRYFATDASIFQVAPALVVYPRNENDVRKTCRFSWQLAERGRVIPITARGSGTDQTGAAVGGGIMVVFPAHMNRILALDTKDHTVTIEPGINFGKLQQTLHTHGRFLPPYPASAEYSTVGGAVANNASGEKSVKYGGIRSFVRALRVVLANGEVMEIRRLTKRELNKKLGLATFEGEIYRSVDTILEEQAELVASLARNVTRNNAGYNLLDIKKRDGSFDLTPLFVGSQGTLGVVTEAKLATEAYNPQNTLLMAGFDSLENLQNAVVQLRDLTERPSSVELLDANVLEQVSALNPNQLKDVVAPPYPQAVLLVEFDTNSERHLKKAVKKATKVFEKYAASLQTTNDSDEQQVLWKLRQAVGSLVGHNEGPKRSAPIVGNAAVPPDRLREFMEGIYTIAKTNNLPLAVWGHPGDGILHAEPKLNLGQVGDRQRAFRVIDEFNKLVVSLGGTVSAESGDGRLHTPYLEAQYGTELYALLRKIQQVFDPYGTMNPGVKFGTSVDDLKAIVNPNYGLDHLYDHLPKS